MQRLWRHTCAIVALATFTTAHASTISSEITDMWWNPAEPGWGVNVILQSDIAFLTFFLYDAAQNPVWYTSDVHYQGPDATGALLWTGNLFATRGPWFRGAYNPPDVTVRPVGTVSFSSSHLGQATLTYSIDGVTVTKSLERQTWRGEDYSGAYAGVLSLRYSNCNPASLNGLSESAGIVTISQTGQDFAVTLAGATSCTFSGTYAQSGKLGQVNGSVACSNGTQGSFLLVELTPTISGFNGRLVGQDQYCQWSGYIGGVTRP